MNYKALDPRLSLAFDLYDSCRLAADIGTDHAHLPAALLQRGTDQVPIRMGGQQQGSALELFPA